MDLQNDSPRRDIRNREADLLDLRDADVAGFADLYNRLGVIGVAEEGAEPRGKGGVIQ